MAIAVNNMFLNLRNPDDHSQGSKPMGIVSSLPEINFTQNRFLGNIGAPVEHEQWDGGFDENEEEIDDVERLDL